MIELSERQKAKLLKSDAAELERLASAYYDTVYTMTESEREALLSLLDREGGISEREIKESAVYKKLVKKTLEALTVFAGFLLVTSGTVSRKNTELGAKDALDLIIRGGQLLNIRLKPNSIPLDALIHAQNLLRPDGPLIARIKTFDAFHAEDIGQKIIDAVRKGWNPIRTAKELKKVYSYPLTDALRMTRTVQIYSYRRASHDNYRANGEVVHGWIWYAKLDGLTCLSCIDNHGKAFPLDEELNDHHNGRCTAIPAVFGYNPVDTTGEDWFNGLTEAEQAKIMGKGKFNAWKEGKISFGQFSVENDDPVYGRMKTEASLKSLLED